MKLLNRLRELRDEHYPTELNETEYAHATYADLDDEHLDTIGVGATTVDDIIRLNLEHGYSQDSISHAHFVY